MLKTKALSLLSASLVVFGLSSGAVFAKDKSPVTVECDDTIAGYGTEVEIATLKDTGINLMLETPSGGRIYLQETSDETGELTVSLADYHLQRSGEYMISARFAEENEDFGQKCLFTVFPGDLSIEKSTLNVNRKTAEAGGVENIIAEVKLVDKLGNPIKGHSIQLMSSNSEDEIQLLSQLSYTDDSGAIAFLVNSEKSGMSTLSAIDLTEDLTLDARTKIAFITTDDIKAIGGDDFEYDSYFEDASIFLSSIADTGEVYELLIELKDTDGDVDEENKIEKNKSASISVSAMDELGNIVPNYTGTVRFSATDENASLPEDYTFTSEDLGVHDFDLGIVFKTEGEQILSINDIDNFAVKGETEFEIVPSEIVAGPVLSTDVNLTSPISGSFKSKEVKISGTAAPNIKVQVLDNDIVLQELITSAEGKFSAALQNIEDGNHSIVVKSIDEEGKTFGQSEEVALTIDSTSPTIESFKLDKDGDLQVDVDINAVLMSETDLSSVSMIIDDRIIELTEDIDLAGKYKGSFKTPANAGSYGIDLVLKDEVGNEGNFVKHTTLTVTEEEEIIPSQVTEISAVGSGGRVTFTWAAAEDDTYITNYKVSYGPDPEELYFEAKTFDSSTTWYIPNLLNGEKNYFGIQAIDSDGNLGPMSELIVAQAIAPKPEMPASLEDPVILQELPKRTPETGPEIWFIALASLLIVDIYYNRRKAVQK